MVIILRVGVARHLAIHAAVVLVRRSVVAELNMMALRLRPKNSTTFEDAFNVGCQR